VGAVVASMRSDPGSAAALFASAAAGWEALRRPYPRARALASHGRALLVLGQRQQAEAVLHEAQAILEDLREKLPEAKMRESFTNRGLLAGVLSALASVG